MNASVQAMRKPPAADPLLSICVPTHDGRRGPLAELIAAVVEQGATLPGLIELCVSDNASLDGTAALLADVAGRAPLRVAYLRHDSDAGLARNLLSAVELARGRYCWLMGSDDLLAEGALARACELIGRLPECTGYAVGARHVDAVDTTRRSRALPRAFYPAGDAARVIDGLEAVFDECGNSWCALSWSIVERAAWRRVARQHGELALAHPVFPQVVMLAKMAEERPRWGWLGEQLVDQRNATTFLFEEGDIPVAERWSTILDGAAQAWRAVIGPHRRRAWRRRMRRLHSVWGGAADVRATKLYGTPSLRAQARLARACLSAFWPSRDYWREVCIASVMPVWLTRHIYSPEPGAEAVTVRSDLSLSAAAPAPLRAGAVVEVMAQLVNRSRRAAPAAGADAVMVAQRWFDASGALLDAEALRLNELAAMPQSLPRSVRGHRTLCFAIALYVPHRPGSYRLELAVQHHGSGASEEADAARRVAHEVEVRADTRAAQALSA